jgi:DNA-binding helix-hairpin-helix protein with protein kinase domain
MAINVGSTVSGLDGSTYRLAKEIGRGAEGSVWSLEGEPGLVGKFRFKGLSSQDVAKISAMCRLRTDALGKIAAWPITLLKERGANGPSGLLMRCISGYQSIHQLYGLKSRLKLFPEAQFPFLLHTAINTARAFATIHVSGQVVGDVNHSNLMVAQNATVAMIDCDSFQISDRGVVFPCPVGVPEFTPPELQGITFAKQPRTVQHDAFGLAVLIFYLLFLGRHPFMGVFDSRRDEMLSLDAAISQYKFAYALDERSPEVRLPPFVPRLSDYPQNVRDLFNRSFTRDAITKGRPTAQEWIGTLVSLSAATKQCKANPNHQYFSNLTQCPWCRVEGFIGMAVFGIRFGVAQTVVFDINALWAQVDSFRAIPELFERPNLEALQAQNAPDPSIPEIVLERRKYRIGGVALLIAISCVATFWFPAQLAVLAIVGALIALAKLWAHGGRHGKPFVEQYSSALAAFNSAEQALDKSAEPPVAFTNQKRSLERDKVEYLAIPALQKKRRADLDAARAQKQRERFLEGFRIEDEQIPNLGEKTKMILYTWGILDASDVELNKISQIKGFGPVRQQSLLVWRASKEAQFRFNPNEPVDPSDLRALEQEFAQKASVLRSRLSAGPASLKQALSVWHAQRRQLLASLHAAANQLARAQVNLRALKKF